MWNIGTILRLEAIGHFAALQMLIDENSLNLPMLEATSEILNEISVYRCIVAVKIWHFHTESVVLLNLIAILENIDNSHAARLGLYRESRGSGRFLMM